MEVMPEPALIAPREPGLLTAGRESRSLFITFYRLAWSLLVAGVVILAIGVYGLDWNNSMVNRLLTYVPLPYGFVRYHPIWFGTVRQQYAAMATYYNQQRIGPAPTEDQAANLLVRRAIGDDLAWSHGLWVTAAEVNTAYQQVVRQAGSEQQVAATVGYLWGMSTATYRRDVLAPYLLRQKLLNYLRRDPVIGRQLGATDDLQLLDAYLDTLRPTTAVLIF